MNRVQKFMAWVAYRAQKYAGLPLRDPALVAMFGGAPAAAGVDVDEDTALNYSAVWRAVNLLSSVIAALPKSVQKKHGNDWVDDPGHPAHRLVAHSPNPEMTPFIYTETTMAHLLIWGNEYSKVDREGEWPVALWPLMPNQTHKERAANGDVCYRFTPVYPDEKEKVYKAEDVLHVPGLGFDGLRGYSVINRAREGVGLGIATERFGAGFFGRGSLPGGVITHPLELSKRARKNLRESFELLHRGPDNAHRIGILDEGMTFNKTDIPMDDAQFLETRQFQVVEIARWFGIPPHMLYHLLDATYTNIEHQGMDFLTYSLMPWLIRIGQSYEARLFSEKERGNYRIHFDTTELAKADIKTRYEAYTQGRNGGWLTLNDIMRREGLNPIKGELGDTRLSPSTMRILGEKNPESPLDPAVVDALIATLESLKPLPYPAAKEIVRAVCPTVPDAFVEAFLAKQVSIGVVAGDLP